MLITETIEINGVQFLHNYSDAGFKVERNGIQYDDAVDPVNSGRVYTETNVPVTVLDVPEEFRPENLG